MGGERVQPGRVDVREEVDARELGADCLGDGHGADHTRSMGRALTAVGALLVLMFVVFGLTVYLARDEDGVAVDNLLAEDLTRTIALAEGRDEQVELSALTDFEWDRVVLVERGTPDAAISRRLGFEWHGDVPIEQGDVFIFLREGALARYADYRGEGRFVDVERPFDEFSRAEAVFEVDDLVVRPAGA